MVKKRGSFTLASVAGQCTCACTAHLCDSVTLEHYKVEEAQYGNRRQTLQVEPIGEQ